MTMSSVSAASATSLSFVDQVESGNVYMSAESLMMYLQTRLGSLDASINEKFQKQQNLEAIHKHMDAIKHELDGLNSEITNTGTQDPGDRKWIDNINTSINAIAEIDQGLADEMRAKLGDGALAAGDQFYLTKEIKNSTEYMNTLTKQLESSAQLEMINLQSTMSNRQTAVQLATNLISSDGDSKKSIVSNIK